VSVISSICISFFTFSVKSLYVYLQHTLLTLNPLSQSANLCLSIYGRVRFRLKLAGLLGNCCWIEFLQGRTFVKGGYFTERRMCLPCVVRRKKRRDIFSYIAGLRRSFGMLLIDG
jgi:hypothetical protein